MALQDPTLSLLLEEILKLHHFEVWPSILWAGGGFILPSTQAGHSLQKETPRGAGGGVGAHGIQSGGHTQLREGPSCIKSIACPELHPLVPMKTWNALR